MIVAERVDFCHRHTSGFDSRRRFDAHNYIFAVTPVLESDIKMF